MLTGRLGSATPSALVALNVNCWTWPVVVEGTMAGVSFSSAAG
jgi:hypothetical protein